MTITSLNLNYYVAVLLIALLILALQFSVEPVSCSIGLRCKENFPCGLPFVISWALFIPAYNIPSLLS